MYRLVDKNITTRGSQEPNSVFSPRSAAFTFANSVSLTTL